MSDPETHVFSSTRIQSATRDPDSGDTVVTFIRGGEKTYTAVPAEIWERWKSAWSPGRFLTDEIEAFG